MRSSSPLRALLLCERCWALLPSAAPEALEVLRPHGEGPAARTDEKEEKKDSRGKERPRSDLLLFLRAQDESALFPPRPRKREHCYKPALTIP